VRGLVPLALAAVALGLAAGASARPAADECRGLLVCIPVEGPWVVIPAPGPGARHPASSWLMRCPEGVVAGLDARLGDASIDISFSGLLGSPVNPGITTTDAVVFTGRYTGTDRRATIFKPFIGCIPTSGGRTPTAVRPGRPATLRVRTVRLRPGRPVRVVQSCRPGERLISSSHAVGLRTKAEPTAAEAGRVRAARVERAGRVIVTASRGGLPRAVRADLQVHALCARGAGQP